MDGAPSPETAAAAAASEAAATPPDTAAPAATETAPAPVANGPTCPNCSVPRHEDDVFCESCGYDFASGSLPDADQQPEAAGSVAPTPVGPPMHAKISFDADFFAASVGDVELEVPDPLPAAEMVPLAGSRALIGRQSTSRGIFPEIDAQALTGDPAVSSRHAMLERTDDGSWTLTDLGSTNGTYRTTAADNAIEPNDVQSLAPGDVFFIGAWTRIELAETT